MYTANTKYCQIQHNFGDKKAKSSYFDGISLSQVVFWLGGPGQERYNILGQLALCGWGACWWQKHKDYSRCSKDLSFAKFCNKVVSCQMPVHLCKNTHNFLISYSVPLFSIYRHTAFRPLITDMKS